MNPQLYGICRVDGVCSCGLCHAISNPKPNPRRGYPKGRPRRTMIDFVQEAIEEKVRREFAE